MSTEDNKESVSQIENASIIKKAPNIPNTKNQKKHEDLNNREEEKIERISSVRNKKKLESNLNNNNKLDSSSITSNGNKNNHNDSNLLSINRNFSFSKIKKITPKAKPNNVRTASAVNLRKNNMKGSTENNQSFVDEKEKNNSSITEKKKKGELSKAKNKSSMNNLSSSDVDVNIYDNNKKSNTSLAKKKDLLNNSFINKRIHQRRSSCEEALLGNKDKESTLEQKIGDAAGAQKTKKFSELYERLTNHKTKITSKVEKMKKKLEEEELKQLKNAPNINKSSKYYEKDSEDFLKRVEIYKFVSKAKRIELIEKDQKKMEEELNKNPKLRKKMKLDEIQKIIDDKLKSDKQKKIEKEQKIQQIKKNLEESKLTECTFAPEISENSKKMDLSFKRNIYNMTKSSSVPKFLETENSKNFNKSVNLDTSQANVNNESNIYQDKSKKRTFYMNSTMNTNNSTNNIFSQNTRNSNNKSLSRNHNEGLKESHSMNKLPEKSVKDINNSNVLLNLSSLNETTSKDENKTISGLPVNISKKESEIIKELLRKKFNI